MTGTINNDDSASISINDVTVSEGNSGTTNAVFTVTLSNPVDTSVTLNYATANGTATTADNDYTAIATTPLTFNVGETSKTITVAAAGASASAVTAAVVAVALPESHPMLV